MAGTTPVAILRIIRLHLDVFTTIDEFTLHQFGAVCGDDIFVLKFESVVSNQPSYSNGVQPGFCNFSSTNPSSCGHHGGAHQAELGNEATTSTEGESVQSPPGG